MNPFISILTCIGLAWFSIGYAQETESVDVPDGLSELSGLELLDGKTLVGINDGGHKPYLYVMELDGGKLIKKVEVTNAKNKDWEDLTVDDTYLYISDLGNNENKRTGLKIYRVKIADVLHKKEVKADKIEVSYAEQTAFPPAKSEFNFDAEAIANHGNFLWIFTKPNTQPWVGNSSIYRVPKTPGTHVLTKQNEINIGDGGWWSDAITAADIYNNILYVSTYNRLILFNFATKGSIKQLEVIPFKSLTQKEALVVLNKKTLIVGDEKHKLFGGGKLYKIELEND